MKHGEGLNHFLFSNMALTQFFLHSKAAFEFCFVFKSDYVS